MPLVASPAIEACWPGKSQGAYHSLRSSMRLPVSMIMNTVEPYMIIMSASPITPTLSASAAASMVPAITGVPGASPVGLSG